MKKSITIKDQRIEYTVKKRRGTKNLRLSINGSGTLVASKPWFLSEKSIEKFILQKAEWIISRLAYFKKINQSNPFRHSSDEYQTYKKQAERLVLRKVAHWNSHYRFRFAQISIRNQKTRWGSCSSQGNLSFNYKMIFLPEKIIDYIIVHELCHLKELNHSERFWKLVAQKMPSHKILRKDLQKKGIELR